MPGIERVEGVRCAVGECPVWNAVDNAWYWTDITARRIWRLDAASGAVRSWEAPEMVACFAFREDGGLVAGMQTGVFELRLGDGPLASAGWLAAPVELGAGMRFNDGRCDRQGRFWSGTMFMDSAAERDIGRLYRYTAEGLSPAFVSGLLTQNGLGWSPDGRTMYLSDSHPKSQMVWAFDYDVDAGVPHNQRVFVDMKPQRGRPDGAAVDADGCYWICGNDEGCVHRFAPDGRLDRTIDLPMAKPSMCSFGGAKLDTLLVTSINPGNDTTGWAGSVVTLWPGVTGVAETLFRG